MSLDALLDSIYTTSQGADSTAIEKTAEARMLDALSDTSGGVGENPYANLSLDELMKLAAENGVNAPLEVEADEHSGDDEGDFEKQAAYEAFGGQVMAHAAVHEMGLIKEALANGLCRVCKTNHLDVESSSICSECLGG